MGRKTVFFVNLQREIVMHLPKIKQLIVKPGIAVAVFSETIEGGRREKEFRQALENWKEKTGIRLTMQITSCTVRLGPFTANKEVPEKVFQEAAEFLFSEDVTRPQPAPNSRKGQLRLLDKNLPSEVSLYFKR